MRRIAAATLGLLVASAVLDGADGQPVDAVLRGLLGTPAAAGVRVEGRLERDGDGAELVVALRAEGGAKLVADPGIQIVPLPGPRGTWAQTDRVELVEPGRAYLEPHVELRVPVAPGATGEAAAEIAYAWCVVERICLFGQATVSVPLADLGG